MEVGGGLQGFERANRARLVVASSDRHHPPKATEKAELYGVRPETLLPETPLHPDSRPCTAMSTPLGPMQWKVVPMGAKNGNAAFQMMVMVMMMEDLLGPVRDCADPFVDDSIIGSGTEDMTKDELIEAHEKDLRRVCAKRAECRVPSAECRVQAHQSLTLREGSGVRGSRGWSRATPSHASPDHQRTPILHGVL